MLKKISIYLFFVACWSSLTQAETKVSPANKLLVCAMQTNRAAFATDAYGNLIFCAKDTCQEIMPRPGSAEPVNLSCVNESFAYIYYSNQVLYRCHSLGRCVEMKMQKKLLPKTQAKP